MIRREIVFTLLVALSISTPVSAQSPIAALDTNGAVLLIDAKTGEITPKAEEPLSGFSLGGTARATNTLYYVAEPTGSDENSIYTVSLKSGTVTHVDLDRSESVRALFVNKRKLYGVFYDGTLGSAGVYRIDPATGVTTLVLDFSSLDLEPIAGSVVSFGGFYFLLAKPEADSGQRKMLRFKLKSSGAVVIDVLDKAGAPVLCNKMKPNAATQRFVCLAQDLAETQVSVCRLSLKGKAVCSAALSGVLRVGSGHTMLTPDQNRYYAFVYAPGEPDNQRLIRFNARGAVKANIPLSTIAIGAHFPSEAAVVQ